MKYKIYISQKAKDIVGKLSFKQLLNQVCCPAFKHFGEEGLDDFGAMFFHPNDKDYLQRIIGKFKAISTVPPFIVSDMEHGAGDMVLGATKFPSMMAMSQTDSAELVYEVGKIAAEEAGAIGYNWTFSPVADLACNYDSPVVSTRSAGKNPEHVVKILDAYIRGLQENGMMATIKHFPGDGYGTYDQHLTTPENPLDMETWRKYPGRVFKELIDKGVMAIMPGHISLPAYDDIDEKLGVYPPATLSKKLLVDLLRRELGFEGLIVTDAFEMGGVVGYMNYYDACATALENGCDILLFPRIDKNFYAEMEKQVQKGNLSIDTLKERACRIVSLKEQMGLFSDSNKKNYRTDLEKSNKLAETIVDKSITIVRDRNGLIPFNISKDTRVLHLVIMNSSSNIKLPGLLENMKKEIEKYSGHVTQMIDPGPDALFKIMYEKQYDLVICSIGQRISYGLNVARLHDEVARNMMCGWMKFETPVIFVSHFHPYIHKEYAAAIDTIINTYDNIDCTPKRLLEGITGSKPLKRQVLVHD